jgi:G3E family GTPase
MKDKPWIVLVGGFLGAGKTTLLLAASRELDRRGMRSALILNDQGNELVDTSFVSVQGLLAKDVTGGCFCCRFSDLVRRIDELAAFSPDVIFAEPVGSCTDLSATIVHPLLQNAGKYAVAPYTVLVDPVRDKALSRRDADSDLKFLFGKQLAEADIVCFTKADIYPDEPPIH